MQGVSIFMYHQVGKFLPMKTHRASYCDVDNFRAHMRTLKWLGVKVLSVDELVQVLSGAQPMPERAAVLTFDDGCLNFMEYALPVLKAYGYPAMVYAIASLAGKDAAWMAADGHPTPPLMNFDQLRFIQSEGIGVGSHAYSHVHLAQLPYEAQLQELVQSKEVLEQELGRAVKHVCYPYGSYNLDTLKAAQQAGYLTGMTCERAAAVPENDLLALPRKAISYGDSMVGFSWKLFFKNQPKTPILSRTGINSK